MGKTGSLLLEILLLGYITFYLKVLWDTLFDWKCLPKLEKVNPLPLDNLPPVLDIVIPARNEGEKIRRCLKSLQNQTYTTFQVWMVNDRSTDETEAIMKELVQEDSRFHLIQGIEPPPGWVGKVNAIAQAIPFLSAPWILFLDADTWLHPETLQRSLTYTQQHQVEFFTLIPYLECGTFWEHVILPAMVFLISLEFPSRQVNNSQKPNIAIANGQYILIQRPIYEKLGTHATVKGSVIEDLDLARLAKRQGIKLTLAIGVSYFHVRMYTSFTTLREGWTKNLYLGKPDLSPWLTAFRIMGLWLLGFLPIVTFCISLFSSSHHAPLMFLSALALGTLFLSMAFNRWVYKCFPGYALLHPLALFVIGCFLYESRRLALSPQGILWKGRHYKTKPE